MLESNNGNSKTPLWEQLQCCASELSGDGNYAEASVVGAKSLALLRASRPVSSESAVRLLSFLVWQRVFECDYTKARNLVDDAQKLVAQLQSKASLTSLLEEQQATIFALEGRYSEAQDLYEKIVRAEEVVASDRLNLGGRYLCLADTFVRQGKLKESQDFFQKSLSNFQKNILIAHPDTIKGFDCLKSLYSNKKSQLSAKDCAALDHLRNVFMRRDLYAAAAILKRRIELSKATSQVQ